jgi:hypothetical protein
MNSNNKEKVPIEKLEAAMEKILNISGDNNKIIEQNENQVLNDEFN